MELNRKINMLQVEVEEKEVRVQEQKQRLVLVIEECGGEVMEIKQVISFFLELIIVEYQGIVKEKKKQIVEKENELLKFRGKLVEISDKLSEKDFEIVSLSEICERLIKEK